MRRSSALRRAALVVLVLGAAAAERLHATQLYWTDANFFGTAAARVSRARADGTDIVPLVTPGGINHGFLAFDVTSGKVYWADSYLTGEPSIRRANLDGTGVETVVSTAACPMGLAIDPAQGKLYWTDCSLHTVQRANTDGSGIETLVTGLGAPFIGSPQGLALDLVAGKMYWANTAAGMIQRANLDGTGVEDLVAAPNAQGLVLDLQAGKLYWTGNGLLGTANLDGTAVEILTFALRNPVGVAVDHDAGLLYWADLYPGEIWRAGLDGSGMEPLITGLDTPWGLALLPTSDDTTPPRLSVEATPAVLWPADHRMVPIAISVNATDDRGPVTVVLRSVTSSEPDDSVADGATSLDIQDAMLGTDDRSLLLRAERSALRRGRTYTMTYEATDQAGNVTVASTTVAVPLSNRWGMRSGWAFEALRRCAAGDGAFGAKSFPCESQSTVPR